VSCPCHSSAPISVIKALLSAPNIDVNAQDDDGKSAVSMLLSKHERWHGRIYPCLCHEALAMLLAMPSIQGVRQKDEQGRTALMRAAASGASTQIFKVLLAAPEIDVNAEDMRGSSALALAAAWDEPDLVALLLAVPFIQVNHKDKLGRTALIDAIVPLPRAGEGWNRSGIDSVKALLSAPDTDVNAEDEQGRSALARAAECGMPDVVALLLAVPSIQVNHKDKWGRTALIVAIASKSRIGYHHGRSIDSVKALLSAPGTDVNAEDQQGNSALTLAAALDASDVVALLLAVPSIQVNHRNKLGRTALMVAIASQPRTEYGRRGRIDSVRALLAVRGIDVNAVDAMAIAWNMPDLFALLCTTLNNANPSIEEFNLFGSVDSGAEESESEDEGEMYDDSD